MNLRKLKILESAFAAEIDCAVEKKGFGLIQTKSKLAAELADEGYLQRVQVNLPGSLPVTIHGYALTPLGNYTYCTSGLCVDKETE